MTQKKGSLNSNVPDYTGDKDAAFLLAKRVQEYYHKRGFKKVRCWAEPQISSTGKKIWGVQSNITFSVQ